MKERQGWWTGERNLIWIWIIKSKFDIKQKLAFSWSVTWSVREGSSRLNKRICINSTITIRQWPQKPFEFVCWAATSGRYCQSAQQTNWNNFQRNIFARYSSRMSTCSDPDRPDTDDENSQRSYSNASSPSASLQPTPNYVSTSCFSFFFLNFF